jgi:tRNA threonylcarbamoyladenosine biosynthesis protein TsaE
MDRPTNETFKVAITSEEQTAALASAVSEHLRAGDVICLRGDLGTGKTTFTRSLVAGLGSPARVSSPTFTLVHEYRGGRLPVWHVDAYRLRTPDDIADIGLDEVFLMREGVVVIEWPERIEAALPEDHLDISIHDTSGDTREIDFIPNGPRWTDFPKHWAALT